MEKPPNCIRQIRLAAKLSQQAVADKVGISKVTISSLERGRMQLTLEYMRRISSVFSLAPVDLLLKQEQEWLIGADEMQLIRAYRAAGLLQREIIHRVAEPSQLLGDKQAKGSKPVDLLNRSANDPFELNQ